MTDRILSIIKYYHLSPSDFAEEIGVQRSSISHLISGRNKPSLEFVQKILARFPEISSEWLLTGKGEMITNGLVAEQGTLFSENTTVKEEKKTVEDLEEPIKRETSRIPVKKKVIDQDERQVEKIIYLYKDKTFREYYPE